MSICESEENRKKLAWLVPGYILLAWFFCVLFQPLSIRSGSSATSSSSSSSSPASPGAKQSWMSSTARDDAHYRVVYLNSEEAVWPYEGVCKSNGSVITLTPGAMSSVIVRISPGGWYPFRPFNCSIRVEAGEGLDGVTAVIEELDLREHEDDARQPGGHWGSSVCVDYLEAYTDSAAARNKLCGQWHVEPDDRLTTHGPRQTLVGYCYDDINSGRCETKGINLNVVIDSPEGRRLEAAAGGKPHGGLKLHSRKRGFSVTYTGYRHGDENTVVAPPEHDDEIVSDYTCGQGEFTCPSNDFSAHSKQPHCVWDRLRCDAHLNCGFLISGDESGCSDNTLLHMGRGGNSIPTWSISTMTLLIIVYLAIVLVLVLVTMVLLRWHKALRTPLDVLAESRGGGAYDPATSVSAADHRAHYSVAGRGVDDRRRTGVSIIVAYRARSGHPGLNQDGTPKTTEAPPSYESLFATATPTTEEVNERPPNYNVLTATFNIARRCHSRESAVDDAQNGPADTDGANAAEEIVLVHDHNDQEAPSQDMPSQNGNVAASHANESNGGSRINSQSDLDTVEAGGGTGTQEAL